MEYFSYDYVYYSEGSVDEEEEEKVVEKVEKEEDRVIIVEEEGSQKAFSGASGTFSGQGRLFSLTLLVLLRFLK